MISLSELIAKAKEEAKLEDEAACKEGLKVLTKRKDRAERELEDYKVKIQNDPTAAADMFGGDNMGRSSR